MMTSRSPRRPVIAGNWKMNPASEDDAVALAIAVAENVQGLDVTTVLCPPAVWLLPVASAVRGRAAIGAQTMAAEESGAFTGETSPLMLRGIAEWVILGHSERRQYFGETDETTAQRADQAFAWGLRVIACVGETETQREAGETEDVLRRQVSALPRHPDLVVAYEPVWAIGTGKTATPELAQEAHAFIKSLLDAPVLYGGSVKPDNAGALLAQPDVDGALVGGASLEVDSFKAICETAARIPS